MSKGKIKRVTASVTPCASRHRMHEHVQQQQNGEFGSFLVFVNVPNFGVTIQKAK